MSLHAFGIMLKPILAKYLEPLEEDGTIAKLQRDIALIANSNAIPELATLVSELQEHNRLMRRLFELIEGAAHNGNSVEPGADTRAAGHDGNIDSGLPELPSPD